MQAINATFEPQSIQQAAQVSAACSLVGWKLTYNGGRKATGSLAGVLQETNFSASFPNDMHLPPTVMAAIRELQSATRAAAGHDRKSERYARAMPSGDADDRRIEKAKEALREALRVEYGIDG